MSDGSITQKETVAGAARQAGGQTEDDAPMRFFATRLRIHRSGGVLPALASSRLEYSPASKRSWIAAGPIRMTWLPFGSL